MGDVGCVFDWPLFNVMTNYLSACFYEIQHVCFQFS